MCQEHFTKTLIRQFTAFKIVDSISTLSIRSLKIQHHNRILIKELDHLQYHWASRQYKYHILSHLTWYFGWFAAWWRATFHLRILVINIFLHILSPVGKKCFLIYEAKLLIEKEKIILVIRHKHCPCFLFPYRTTFGDFTTTRQSLFKKRINISFTIHLSIYLSELSVINDTKQSSETIEVKKDHNARWYWLSWIRCLSLASLQEHKWLPTRAGLIYYSSSLLSTFL